MIGLAVTITAAEGKGDLLEKEFQKLVPQVKKNEPGTVTYVVLRDTRNPSKFYVCEQYRTQEDLNKHAASEHYKAFAKAIPALLAAKPEINFCKEVS